MYYASLSLRPKDGADVELMAELADSSVNRILGKAVQEYLAKQRRIINKAWSEGGAEDKD
jgi:hypothetical protein